MPLAEPPLPPIKAPPKPPVIPPTKHYGGDDDGGHFSSYNWLRYLLFGMFFGYITMINTYLSVICYMEDQRAGFCIFGIIATLASIGLALSIKKGINAILSEL